MIILLTGVDMVYDIRNGVAGGWVRCDRFVTKPAEPKLLLDTIAALLPAVGAARGWLRVEGHRR